MPRTIAIDYRMCHSSGIGVYLRSVVRHLADEHKDLRLIRLGGDPVPGVLDHRPLRSSIYSISEQVELPVRLPRATDVLWSPNYNAPFVSRGRLVVTVHDACHLALPQLLGGGLKLRYARTMFANVKRRAARVICDSEFTASEVVRLVGLNRDRITVIYPGLDRFWQAPVATGRPIDPPYALFVGNVKPHKNLGRLLDAFDLLKSRIPHTLVIVGKREGFITPDRAILSAAGRFGARVQFTGEVSEDELRAWYAHADLLVHPSLYEGFGFPPLEAMASGVPVAASTAGSLPEICGDAAAYFDPYSIDEMASVIERVASDQSLRASLADRGKGRITRYSWPDASARIASVLRDAAD